jgi:hypothetical protein
MATDLSREIWDGTELQETTATVDQRDLGGAGAGPTGFVGGRSFPGYVGAFNWIIPEYNPALQGAQAIRVYDQMRKSDGQVRASLRMVKAPILAAQWYMAPASQSPQDKLVADEIEYALFHMPKMNGRGRPFMRFLREATSFLDFGFYPFELQWKTIENWTPPASESRQRRRQKAFTILRDMTPRHPIRTYGFYYDEHGQVSDLIWGVNSATIPAEKMLLLSFDEEGDDPTGISILRSAYFHWYAKTNFYKIDGIQKERMSVGIPDIELAPGYSPDDKTAAEEMGRNMRSNERAYIVRPPNIKPGFIETPNAHVNPLDSAQHHGLMILQNVLVQFLSLGTQESGSRAVGGTQTEAFLDALRYVSDYVRGEINSQVVSQLTKFNYGSDTPPPELRVRHLRENDVWRSMSVALRNFVEPGLLTPDADLETFLRSILELPPPTDEVLARSVEDRTMPLPERVTERIQVPGQLGKQGQLEAAPQVKPAGQGTNPDGSQQGSRTGRPVQ